MTDPMLIYVFYVLFGVKNSIIHNSFMSEKDISSIAETLVSIRNMLEHVLWRVNQLDEKIVRIEKILMHDAGSKTIFVPPAISKISRGENKLYKFGSPIHISTCTPREYTGPLSFPDAPSASSLPPPPKEWLTSSSLPSRFGESELNIVI
jgi:hypothetical protein